MKGLILPIGAIFVSAVLLVAALDEPEPTKPPIPEVKGTVIEKEAPEKKTQVESIKLEFKQDTEPTPVIKTRPVQVQNCHPSYSGACLKPNASDYDCAGGSGNGPYYTGPVRVIGPDVYGLDRDHDGWGCE